VTEAERERQARIVQFTLFGTPAPGARASPPTPHPSIWDGERAAEIFEDEGGEEEAGEGDEVTEPEGVEIDEGAQDDVPDDGAAKEDEWRRAAALATAAAADLGLASGADQPTVESVEVRRGRLERHLFLERLFERLVVFEWAGRRR
jgi:hypothetical protein